MRQRCAVLGAAVIAAVAVWAPAAPVHAQASTEPPAAEVRCTVGDLALPAPGPWTASPDGLWSTAPIEDLPEGRTGCYAMRVTGPDRISGVVLFVASPRTTPDGDRDAQVQAVSEAVVRLQSMNVQLEEPTWRKADVPFSGMPGFGHGTMFGFDGKAVDGGEPSSVVLLVFEGPAHLYVTSLVGAAEAVHPAEWKAALAGYRAMLAGLNKVARPGREPNR